MLNHDRPARLPEQAARREGVLDMIGDPETRAMAAGDVADLKQAAHALEAADGLGSWLSAALDDPNVCREMKSAIESWFDATSAANEPAFLAEDYLHVADLIRGAMLDNDRASFNAIMSNNSNMIIAGLRDASRAQTAISERKPKVGCVAAPDVAAREAACREPWSNEDGVPYCDTCGYYRDTIHRQQIEAQRQRKRS